MTKKIFMIFLLLFNAQSSAMEQDFIDSSPQHKSIADLIANINQQDGLGNTQAHSLPPIQNRLELVSIVNIFIAKGLQTSLKNNQGKTAKEVAMDNFVQCNDPSIKWCYRSYANLLDQLERNKSTKGQFVLEKDGNTISYRYS